MKIDNVIAALTEPEKLYSYSEALEKLKNVEGVEGLYAWYFKKPPKPVPEDARYNVRYGKTLLYVGETTNLGGRIKGHYSHQSNSSTLRRSLGVLFKEDIGGFVYRVRSNGKRYYHFSKDGEKWLSDWMQEHVCVCWAEYKGANKKARTKIEEEIIKDFFPPLNIKKGTHRFSCELEKMRCMAKLDATKAESK